MAKPQTISSQTSAIEAVEAYLATIPEPARTTVLKLRETIRSIAPPEATEEMGYGVPSFRYKDRLVGYTGGKNFCSYYPMSGSVITTLKDDLKAYPTSAGAIRFPIDKPLPATLVKKLIQTRLKQIETKAAKKQPKRPTK
jgi:uncharacterized protein YdhG (YjbR/CyaY superfamily)